MDEVSRERERCCDAAAQRQYCRELTLDGPGRAPRRQQHVVLWGLHGNPIDDPVSSVDVLSPRLNQPECSPPSYRRPAKVEVL